MHTHLVGIADIGSTQVGTRHQPIDECGLPHPAVATEQRDFTFQQRTQLLDALASLCRDGVTLIADVFIKEQQVGLLPGISGVKQVALIKNKVYGHAIGFC